MTSPCGDDLRGLVDRDPWLTRRVLDAIAVADQLPVGGAGLVVSREVIEILLLEEDRDFRSILMPGIAEYHDGAIGHRP